MKSYAVVFAYQNDFDTPVYLFDTEQEAQEFLNDAAISFNCKNTIYGDNHYAKVFTADEDGKNRLFAEIRLGRVYL